MSTITELPPPKTLCFHLYLFFCLSVCLLTALVKKLLIKLLWNFTELLDITPGLSDYISVAIRIRIQEFLKEFFHCDCFGNSRKIHKLADFRLKKGCLPWRRFPLSTCLYSSIVSFFHSFVGLDPNAATQISRHWLSAVQIKSNKKLSSRCWQTARRICANAMAWLT